MHPMSYSRSAENIVGQAAAAFHCGSVNASDPGAAFASMP